MVFVMRKLSGEIESCEARDPSIEEVSLREDVLGRSRLEGVQQRERGSRLGCGIRQLVLATASGSTVGAAEEQVSPSASICASALGLTGTLLTLVFGITVPSSSSSEVRRFFRRDSPPSSSIQSSRCNLQGHRSEFLQHRSAPGIQILTHKTRTQVPKETLRGATLNLANKPSTCRIRCGPVWTTRRYLQRN